MPAPSSMTNVCCQNSFWYLPTGVHATQNDLRSLSTVMSLCLRLTALCLHCFTDLELLKSIFARLFSSLWKSASHRLSCTCKETDEHECTIPTDSCHSQFPTADMLRLQNRSASHASTMARKKKGPNQIYLETVRDSYGKVYAIVGSCSLVA